MKILKRVADQSYKTLWFLVALMIILLSLKVSLMIYKETKNQKTRSTESATALPILGKIPDFSLVNQNGVEVQNSDLKGSVWVANLIFTRCAGPCPLMSSQLQSLQRKLGNEGGIKYVSFSVDPEYDKPEVLAKYAEKYEADPKQWIFLTGEKQSIFRIANQHMHLGVGDLSADEVAVMDQNIWHSTKFVLVDGMGQIRGYYESEDISGRNQLISDIKKL